MKLRSDALKPFVLACLFALGGLSCGVDRLQHVARQQADGSAGDGGTGDLPDAGTRDAGTIDAGLIDAGSIDAGAEDAGTEDAGPTDAGPGDAGWEDAGMVLDAGRTCTASGISPELAALPGGPYQNCQGGTIPRTDIQTGTMAWSGCCGDLVRVCQVTGFSTMNAVYCR
jgi:hypothetical protein